MNVDVPKSLKQLKLWTSLLQHFVAKALTFDFLQFTYELFHEMLIQSKEREL